MIKKFKCGLCKQEKRYYMARHSLRKHLREEHRIMDEITNKDTSKRPVKQNWWIEEEWE